MDTLAVIFDWDGVIVDSREYHDRSWKQMAQENGYMLDDDFYVHCFGMRNCETIMDYLKWTSDAEEAERLSQRKEVLYLEHLRNKGIEPLPGVRELLQLLHEQGIPHAVASSSSRENIEGALEAAHLANAFDAICTAADVQAGKPAPDIFLFAAQQLGLPPSRCVVIEDAPVGVAAGKAAGMKVVAVTNSHPAERLYEADCVIDAMSELSLSFLKQLVGAADA